MNVVSAAGRGCRRSFWCEEYPDENVTPERGAVSLSFTSCNIMLNTDMVPSRFAVDALVPPLPPFFQPPRLSLLLRGTFDPGPFTYHLLPWTHPPLQPLQTLPSLTTCVSGKGVLYGTNQRGYIY